MWVEKAPDETMHYESITHTVFKFISRELIINKLSARDHPDRWLPWILSNKDHRQG